MTFSWDSVTTIVTVLGLLFSFIKFHLENRAKIDRMIANQAELETKLDIMYRWFMKRIGTVDEDLDR